MKRIFWPVSWLISTLLAFLSTGQASAAVTLLSKDQFIQDCITGNRMEADSATPDIKIGKVKIKIYRLKDGFTVADHFIIVTLKRGSDKDQTNKVPTLEIPIFKSICPSDKTINVYRGKFPGDIEFTSTNSLPVSVVFHRDDSELNETQWKQDKKDATSGAPSVWMIPDPHYGHENDPPQPLAASWCFDDNSTYTAKKVAFTPKVKASEVSFVTCDDYTPIARYELHMIQTGADNFPVDIIIDPQIIHRPN